MAPPSDPATVLVFKLMQEFHALKGKRFIWTSGLRDRIIADWKTHFQSHRQWSDKAQLLLQRLSDEGQTELADMVARKLLAEERVLDPAGFSIGVKTGFGFETFRITGSEEMGAFQRDPQPQPPSATSPNLEYPEAPGVESTGAPGQDRCVAHQHLSPQEPVEVAWDTVDMSEWPVLTLHEALSSSLWISYTPSGTMFCVKCSCPSTVLPTAPLGLVTAETYNVVPRHFHRDPFRDHFALIHFVKAHNEVFLGGVEEMLGKYVHQGDDGPLLDRYSLAALNSAAGSRHAQLLSTWAGWQAQYHSTRPIRPQRSRNQRISQLNRSVTVDQLPAGVKPFEWPEPGSGHWVVLCSHPDCTSPYFAHHPLLKDRALDHFKSHGLHLQDDLEVLELFGFRVPAISPGDDATNEEPTSSEGPCGVPTPEKEVAEAVEFRSSNGYIEYYRYTHATLYEECQRRQIPVPGGMAASKKISLIKKLKLHDGIPDYTNNAEWPLTRLRQECQNRGLAHTHKRESLIKYLEGYHAKLGQQSQKTAAEQTGLPEEAGETQPDVNIPGNSGPIVSGQPVSSVLKERDCNIQKTVQQAKKIEAQLPIRTTGVCNPGDSI